MAGNWHHKKQKCSGLAEPDAVGSEQSDEDQEGDEEALDDDGGGGGKGHAGVQEVALTEWRNVGAPPDPLVSMFSCLCLESGQIVLLLRLQHWSTNCTVLMASLQICADTEWLVMSHPCILEHASVSLKAVRKAAAFTS